MYHLLSLTNCFPWTSDMILWCTQQIVSPNWWCSFPSLSPLSYPTCTPTIHTTHYPLIPWPYLMWSWPIQILCILCQISCPFFNCFHCSKGYLKLRSFWTIYNFVSFYSKGLLASLIQPPSWRTTPSQLSVTTYSIYLQVPSIFGGHFLHPQPENTLCCGDRNPLFMAILQSKWKIQWKMMTHFDTLFANKLFNRYKINTFFTLHIQATTFGASLFQISAD